MRIASAVLNLMLAGMFAVMAAHWWGRGDRAWAAGFALVAAANVVLAALKFRGRPDEGKGDQP